MISQLFEKILLLEKKDHLIKKLNNLTDEQKDLIIGHFAKFPHLESKIDWNRKDLSWEDFEPLLSKVSKSQFKKNMSKRKMGGLKEGEDYTELYNKDNMYVAQVLSYRGSVYFGSKNFLGYEGKWCISSNDEKYWRKYIKQDSQFLIVAIDQEKYMVDLYAQKVWDRKDKSHSYQGLSEKDYDFYKIFGNLTDQRLVMIKTLVNRLNISESIFDPLYCILNKEQIVVGKDYSLEELNTKKIKITNKPKTISFASYINIEMMPKGFFIDNNITDCTVIYPQSQKRPHFYFHDLNIQCLDYSKSNIQKINLANINQMASVSKVILPEEKCILAMEYFEGYYETPDSEIEFLNTEYQYSDDPNILGSKYRIKSIEELFPQRVQYIEDYSLDLLTSLSFIKTLKFKNKNFITDENIDNLTFTKMKQLRQVSLPFLSDKLELKGQFRNLQNLEYVDLSNTQITTISDSCFKLTSNLKKVVLPTSLTRISSDNFYASQLTDIDLTKTNLQKILPYSFEQTSFKYLKFPQSIKAIGDYLGAMSTINTLDFSLLSNNISIGKNFQIQMPVLNTVILPVGFQQDKIQEFKEVCPTIRFITKNNYDK